MSQQHEYPMRPPPPPGPNLGPSSGSGSAVSPTYVPAEHQSHHVRRPVIPSITTEFLTAQGHALHTPISATVLSASVPQAYTPATPVASRARSPATLVPPPPTPVSRTAAMEPYNPRQWTGRGAVSGAQMVFQQRGNTASSSNVPPSTVHVTGMEASMPSPPPPYSPTSPDTHPPVPITASPMLDSIGFTASPLAERSITGSPQVPMSPCFPPPPNQFSRHRERSASGMAGQFLSNLRGKQPVRSDSQPPQPNAQGNQTVQVPASHDLGRPPAARRAASTGHLQSAVAGPSSGVSAFATPSGRTSPEQQWQPGMPLPGPPPGPPPPGARSQSLNRPVGSSSSSSLSSDATSVAVRRRTMAPSTLGPVPPTPADFVDEPESTASGGRANVHGGSTMNTQQHNTTRPLHINTGASRDSSLTRRPARRDASAGIRERRSKSRAARDSVDLSAMMAPESRPSDLVFSTNSGAISRRREHTRTASGMVDAAGRQQPASQPSSAKRLADHVLTPPYTPATGSKNDGQAGRSTLKAPGSASSDRPISHLLHAPIEEMGTMQAALSPRRPESNASLQSSTKLDPFALQAMERHRKFIEQESAAASDEERLEMFAQYMVHESRLRRDRYAAAYNAMAGEVVDLTRDMWRSYTGTARRAATPSTAMSTGDPTAPSWTSDSHPASANAYMPSSASSYGDFTPGTDASSMGDLNDALERADTRQWPEAFKPSLSPIPSMAVSTVPDEDSSRGRTASRWWERSNSGSGSIGRPDRITKSRRETKYMGVNPANLQAGTESTHDLSWRQSTPEASQQTFLYGPNEYPAEKTGWHESSEYNTPIPTPQGLTDRAYSMSTPGIALLDVSRLVTLPPPYPRHHPAVNNGHPQLSTLRSAHRSLADHADIQKIKDAYLEDDFSATRQQLESAKKRRAELRASIQDKIASGEMSYADAAKAEADFDTAEAERGKADARANFDAFEAKVSHPLNALLTEKLKDADNRMQEIQNGLDNDQAPDPNRAQEEGDEHPERLERLTMLKWLFEAREQLHKDIFDFHAMRSEKFSEVILTPYRIAKAQGKIDEATTFFKKDSADRQIAHAKESQKRFDELRCFMEKNVSRGVEDQLSAFWDIAPGLLEVVQHVPADMHGFQIEIPPQEYGENPSYQQHPMQYLSSLLEHAERSAYQFIEPQTNLLCLLHEVRTAATKANLRLVEIERNRAHPDDADIAAEMVEANRQADSQLTQDLQEKVGEVDRQWREALGDGIDACKERVRSWLEMSGGLDDGMEG